MDRHNTTDTHNISQANTSSLLYINPPIPPILSDLALKTNQIEYLYLSCPQSEDQIRIYFLWIIKKLQKKIVYVCVYVCVFTQQPQLIMQQNQHQ